MHTTALRSSITTKGLGAPGRSVSEEFEGKDVRIKSACASNLIGLNSLLVINNIFSCPGPKLDSKMIEITIIC